MVNNELILKNLIEIGLFQLDYLTRLVQAS